MNQQSCVFLFTTPETDALTHLFVLLWMSWKYLHKRFWMKFSLFLFVLWRFEKNLTKQQKPFLVGQLLIHQNHQTQSWRKLRKSRRLKITWWRARRLEWNKPPRRPPHLQVMTSAHQSPHKKWRSDELSSDAFPSGATRWCLRPPQLLRVPKGHLDDLAQQLTRHNIIDNSGPGRTSPVDVITRETGQTQSTPISERTQIYRLDFFRSFHGCHWSPGTTNATIHQSTTEYEQFSKQPSSEFSSSVSGLTSSSSDRIPEAFGVTTSKATERTPTTSTKPTEMEQNREIVNNLGANGSRWQNVEHSWNQVWQHQLLSSTGKNSAIFFQSTETHALSAEDSATESTN